MDGLCLVAAFALLMGLAGLLPTSAAEPDTESAIDLNASDADLSELDDLDLEIPEDLKLPSLWVPGVEVRLWSGYNDNLMLAPGKPEKSVLGAAGLDLSLFRLPVGGWEWFFLSSADYIRYPNAREAKEEASAIVQAQGEKRFAETWKAGASAEYLYFNQVFDASILEDEPITLKVEAHALTFRPLLSKELPKSFRLELELPATRQLFSETLDDYWEFGPRLELGREFGRSADLAMSYQFTGRFHDTRNPRDVAGNLQSGRLEFYEHEAAISWRQFWDAERRWRTVTKLNVEWNDDNGGGYYAYVRPQFSQQIRYRTKTWEAELDARVSHYAYDHQHTDGADSPRRERTYVSLNLRAEKVLWKGWRLFAEYEFERAISNLEADDYSVNTIGAGVSWEF
ncbi:MAG: hypothetical protein AB9869_30750 [Verrucomicrobiia bacterium]